MLEDLLKLGCRFCMPVRGQQSVTAHIGPVQTAKIMPFLYDPLRVTG